MGSTRLHQAALSSDIQAAAAAIAAGTELNELDDSGQTALHWAVFRGDEPLVDLLLTSGADPNVFSRDGVTPCWRAVDFGLATIEQRIRAHGGRVATNDTFDRASFSVFGAAIGQPIPREDDT
jgi:ankyrin repeat protein